MRILVVASYNRGSFAPYVVEQIEALCRAGCDVAVFGVHGKGLKGYLENLPALMRKVHSFCPDIIHAHYGLSGLLASLQRKVPVVVTYHGSDINKRSIFRFSKMAMLLSAWDIFVSRKTMEIAKPKKKYTLLPCGINVCDLQMTDKQEARRKMHLQENKEYVLFSSAFDNQVKNAHLAQDAVNLLSDENVELLELKDYSRDEVTLLMCAADAFLMTSNSEGSPQVIKEALACGCPIVSVDVGDVKERIRKVEGCYIAETREPQELSELLQKVIMSGKRVLGRDAVINDGLDNKQVAQRLIEIYQKL